MKPCEMLATCEFGLRDCFVPVCTAWDAVTTAVVCSPWSVCCWFSTFKDQRGESVPHVTHLNPQFPHPRGHHLLPTLLVVSLIFAPYIYIPCLYCYFLSFQLYILFIALLRRRRFNFFTSSQKYTFSFLSSPYRNI